MITVTIKNEALSFETAEKLFSPGYADKGTLAMLGHIDFSDGDKVLDLGCGYGLVGILAARLIGPANVVMVDIDPLAVETARVNIERNQVEGITLLQSNGFTDMHESNFSLIISHPPYHVDFDVPKHFIEKGFNRLRQGGRMVLVTKRKEWYKNKMIAIFGGVRIWEENGYFVFMSVKNTVSYANKKSK